MALAIREEAEARLNWNKLQRLEPIAHQQSPPDFLANLLMVEGA
jgi:hypothetical protein